VDHDAALIVVFLAALANILAEIACQPRGKTHASALQTLGPFYSGSSCFSTRRKLLKIGTENVRLPAAWVQCGHALKQLQRFPLSIGARSWKKKSKSCASSMSLSHRAVRDVRVGGRKRKGCPDAPGDCSPRPIAGQPLPIGRKHRPSAESVTARCCDLLRYEIPVRSIIETPAQTPCAL